VAGYGKSAVAHAVARQFDELGRLGSSYCFDRADLLEVLARRAADLPTNFRVLITARPETDILKAFFDKQHIHCRYLNDIDKSSNERDISLFIETKLSGVPDLETKWPNKGWCRMLLEGSDGLFQCASTAYRAIKDGQAGLLPTELLTWFCSSIRGLDGLYLQVLSSSFDQNDAIVMSRFKLVMGRILLAKEPLSISAHLYMFCASDDAKFVSSVTQSMGSLLGGVHQLDTLIRALHASYYDFLADESRSKSFYVDASQQHRSLVLSTFQVMTRELRFNICNLNTSYHRNIDVPDLTTRVANIIRPHLSYTCCFWADHLIATAYDSTVLNELQDFHHHRLLYWLEVLSLTKNINVASRALYSLQEWIKVSVRIPYPLPEN
jgi:hypothetical protein